MPRARCRSRAGSLGGVISSPVPERGRPASPLPSIGGGDSAAARGPAQPSRRGARGRGALPARRTGARPGPGCPPASASVAARPCRGGRPRGPGVVAVGPGPRGQGARRPLPLPPVPACAARGLWFGESVRNGQPPCSSCCWAQARRAGRPRCLQEGHLRLWQRLREAVHVRTPPLPPRSRCVARRGARCPPRQLGGPSAAPRHVAGAPGRPHSTSRVSEPPKPRAGLRIRRVTTFGESHGKGVGCIIDGVPPRLRITEEEIQVIGPPHPAVAPASRHRDARKCRRALPRGATGAFPPPPPARPSSPRRRPARTRRSPTGHAGPLPWPIPRPSAAARPPEPRGRAPGAR